MEQLQINARFPNIPSENRDRFRKLAGECVDIVRDKEPDTLRYDWFFSDDGSTCVVREAYANSDAVMAHMGNLGETLGELLGVAGALELEVYGDPSAELREATAAFQPAIYSYFAGK